MRGVRGASRQGVPPDGAEAARWWRRAADAGHVDGMFNLGRALADEAAAALADEPAAAAAARAGAAGPGSVLGAAPHGESWELARLKEALGYFEMAAERGDVEARAEAGGLKRRIMVLQSH